MSINLIETKKKKRTEQKMRKINVMLIYVFSHISWTQILYFVCASFFHSSIQSSLLCKMCFRFCFVLIVAKQKNKSFSQYFFARTFSRFSDTAFGIYFHMWEYLLEFVFIWSYLVLGAWFCIIELFFQLKICYSW